MVIKIGYPPNYDKIRSVFDTSDVLAVFAHGDTIYNPHGVTIPDDVEVHEEVHQLQQGGNPDAWWDRYIRDVQFRYAQELQAFARQYAYVRKLLPPRVAEQALYDLGCDMAEPLYKFGINAQQAASKIRNFAKNVA